MRLGLPELAVIAVLALLIFGPKRLPSLGKSLGESIGAFRQAGKELSNLHRDDEDEE